MSQYASLIIHSHLKSEGIPPVQSRQIGGKGYCKPKSYPKLDTSEIRSRTDRTNPACPFYGMVGQDAVINQLLPILSEALQSASRTVPGSALMFTGPASTGKTEFAKRLGKAFGTPFIETDSNQIKGTDDVYRMIAASVKESGDKLVEKGQRSGKKVFAVPSLTFFIDEIHALTPKIMDSLLKTLESKDRTLETAEVYMDVKNVLWIGATTERGQIIQKQPAFDSRFDKIEFSSYTTDQVAKIIQLNFPEWDDESCQALAKRSGCIAREAIAIARKVERQIEFQKLHKKNSDNRLEAIAYVGEQLGIDEHGVSIMHIKLLQALARQFPKGMTYGQLSRVVSRGTVELKECILPPLMVDTPEHPACVYWSGAKSYITKHGMQMLVDRGLISETELNCFEGN